MKRRRARILRVIARLNVGGPAIQAIRLSKDLNNDEFESKLVYGEVSSTEADMTLFPGMQVEDGIKLSGMGRELHPIRDLATLFQLIKIIKRERPDIMHTHTAKAGAVGRLAGALCRVPIILHTFHGHVLTGYFSPPKALVFRFLEWFLTFLSTKIIVTSNSDKQDLQKLIRLSPKKTVVIRIGFHLDKFADCRKNSTGEFRKAVGAGHDDRIIAIIARVVPIKNHALFLRTAKLLIDKGRTDMLFAIVGGGELLDQCRQYAEELGISKRVVFAGWWQDMDKVYADTDITVLTSNNEGTGACLIESMSAGVPVVATDVGGVAEAVKHGVTGFLAPSGDIAALASHIEDLLDNPELYARMSVAGKADMLNRYSYKRLVDDIVSLYRGLLPE